MPTIGLRDLHYAKLISDTPTAVSYDTVTRIIGAISANVNPNASSATLFADDGPFDSSSTMGNIDVELNTADLPGRVQADLLGHTYQNGGLLKKSSDIPPYVAIGYRSLKSNGAYRYTWLFKGKFTPGEQVNNTKGDSVEYQTPTITGAFVKRDYDDAWQYDMDSDDPNAPAAVIDQWFEDVVNPNVAPPTVTGITITTPPTKTTYTVGETFEVGGMVVTAQYDNGSSSIVTAMCTYMPAGALTSGITEVVLAYASGGVTVTANQPITVS